jgi:DNA-binding NarL/FixJ family response regulator
MAPLEAKRREVGQGGKIQIFLVDDHPIVLQGLEQLIHQEADIVVCGRATGSWDAREALPKLPILALSMHDEAVYAERSLRAGAKGYIMKDEATSNLIFAIRKVLRGELYLSEKMTSTFLQQAVQRPNGVYLFPVNRLSDRELEVFELIGKGYRTGEIARELHLSVKTIETYRGHIKEKLGLGSSTQLIQYPTRWVETGA